MEEKCTLKRKIYNNAIVYGLVFLAVVITPFLADFVAVLFDGVSLKWSEPGLLRPFFTHLLTVLFWIFEILAFSLIKKYVKRQKEGDGVETELEREVAASETKGEGKERARLLPMKNLLALFGIAVVCVLLITLQIGFNVKPFYDIGKKINYNTLFNKGGEYVMICFKCVLLQILLKMSFEIFDNVCKIYQMEENLAKWIRFIGTGALIFLFGVYDAIVWTGKYFLTYLFFYVMFTFVYFLTERHIIKSYFLILFIYIF